MKTEEITKTERLKKETEATSTEHLKKENGD